MSNIEKVKVQMFKAYTWYRYLEAKGGDSLVSQSAGHQALAINLLYEECFGTDLIDLWYEMNSDTMQEVALEEISDEEILALMGYLQVRVDCKA